MSLLFLTPYTGFPFVSASNSKSAPSWDTILLALLHITSRPALSLYLFYIVIPPYDLLHVASWLSLGQGLPTTQSIWTMECLLNWNHNHRAPNFNWGPIEVWAYCTILLTTTMSNHRGCLQCCLVKWRLKSLTQKSRKEAEELLRRVSLRWRGIGRQRMMIR